MNRQNSQNNPSKLWLFSGIVLLVMAGLSVWAWQRLPAAAAIPVHWNLSGTPDRYGSKLEGLFLLPLVTAGMALLFTIILYVDPLRQNIQRSNKAYSTVWVVLMLFMAILHTATILIALGWTINIGVVITIALGMLFMVLGNYMGKIRRNYTFGIRTPWTLASDLVWDKTHRLGGKVFMLAGLLILFSTLFVGSSLQMVVMLGGIFGATVVVIVYSYLVWRNEPTQQTKRG
ncbi:MAG: SdpI family protein [Chloroflexi bacterium]|nr:SdpI family protein [Chloroflexota bacterium]